MGHALRHLTIVPVDHLGASKHSRVGVFIGVTHPHRRSILSSAENSGRSFDLHQNGNSVPGMVFSVRRRPCEQLLCLINAPPPPETAQAGKPAFLLSRVSQRKSNHHQFSFLPITIDRLPDTEISTFARSGEDPSRGGTPVSRVHIATNSGPVRLSGQAATAGTTWTLLWRLLDRTIGWLFSPERRKFMGLMIAIGIVNWRSRQTPHRMRGDAAPSQASGGAAVCLLISFQWGLCGAIEAVFVGVETARAGCS